MGIVLASSVGDARGARGQQKGMMERAEIAGWG